MNKTSVSIIVPVYNVAPYVEDCIRSVMRQTYEGKMECIIVDDCGTDDSMAIVERIIEDYNGPITFKILHHTHNRGLSAARNTGIDSSTGDYLYFLDSDDEITDDCIKKLIDVTKEDSKIEIVQGNAMKIPERISDSMIIKFSTPRASSNREVRYCFYYSNKLPVTAWNKLIKRSFIINNKLLFKEGMVFEDLLWLFYTLKYATSISFICDITYLYKIRTDSITAKIDTRSSAKYDKIFYSLILNDLTLGKEKEELTFFTKRFSKRYLNDETPEYEDIFNIFWEKIKCYGFISCYIVIITAYLSKRSKMCKLFFSSIRRINHLSLIMRDWGRVNNKKNSNAYDK